jgi:LysM repeat protein
MKRFVLVISLLWFALSLEAAVAPQDSIGVIKIEDRVFVQYMVSPGETIYGISSIYGVSISELMDINPELEDGLKVKQIINIPYKKTYVEKQKVKNKSKNTHVVQSGETLYSVSKQYGVSIGDLLKWNGMDLKAGQEIVIAYQEKKTAATSVSAKEKTTEKVSNDEITLDPEPELKVKEEPKKIVEQRTATVVVTESIPPPMTQTQILAAEEVYDYDSTMQQVLIIPFDPHLYFSDADDEIASQSKIPRVKVREVFRRRMDALLEPEGYEVIHLLGGQFADSVADLNKIYTSVTYNYQEILYSDNYHQNVPPSEPDKSVKGWMDRQKTKVSGSTATTNSKAIDQGRFEGKYFGVRVKDMNFFEFYHYKYSIDYYVFINQFEVVTDYEHCLDRAAQNYQRYFITHFTVFNKNGKQIAGNKFKVHYDSNSNDVYKIVADNMQKISQRVINELPKIRH